jgi:type II secretory pathway component GspD/PulD (secretin)
VGTRFPIVSSTFSNVAISTRGAVQVGNTPQFTYEDLGITLKTTPHYHSNGDVTLVIDLHIQGLGTLQLNNIPDITTRSYTGTITVHDGEQSMIMGSLSEQELRSTQGLPVLSLLPGLKTFLSRPKERTTMSRDWNNAACSTRLHDQGRALSERKAKRFYHDFHRHTDRVEIRPLSIHRAIYAEIR